LGRPYFLHHSKYQVMIRDTEAIAIYVLREARISPSMERYVDNSCLQKRPAEESVVSTAVGG